MTTPKMLKVNEWPKTKAWDALQSDVHYCGACVRWKAFGDVKTPLSQGRCTQTGIMKKYADFCDCNGYYADWERLKTFRDQIQREETAMNEEQARHIEGGMPQAWVPPDVPANDCTQDLPVTPEGIVCGSCTNYTLDLCMLNPSKPIGVSPKGIACPHYEKRPQPMTVTPPHDEVPGVLDQIKPMKSPEPTGFQVTYNNPETLKFTTENVVRIEKPNPYRIMSINDATRTVRLCELVPKPDGSYSYGMDLEVGIGEWRFRHAGG